MIAAVQKMIYKGKDEMSGSKFSIIRIGAEKRGIPFDINLDFCLDLFRKQKGLCALSGVPIRLNRVQDTEISASLDRIDNSKGYTEENVRWVHKHINKSKWDIPDEEYFFWCEKIAKNN